MEGNKAPMASALPPTDAITIHQHNTGERPLRRGCCCSGSTSAFDVLFPMAAATFRTHAAYTSVRRPSVLFRTNDHAAPRGLGKWPQTKGRPRSVDGEGQLRVTAVPQWRNGWSHVPTRHRSARLPAEYPPNATIGIKAR